MKNLRVCAITILAVTGVALAGQTLYNGIELPNK